MIELGAGFWAEHEELLVHATDEELCNAIEGTFLLVDLVLLWAEIDRRKEINQDKLNWRTLGF